MKCERFHDFGRFLVTLVILRCFFKAEKGKIHKNEWLDTVKKNTIIQQLFSNIIYHSYFMNFMILLVCFIVRIVLGNFYCFTDFHVFQYGEIFVSVNTKLFLTF